MWICYPLVPFFAAAFGFFLLHYPRGGCFWLGGWLGYLVAANILYNLPFSFIEVGTIWFFWIIITITELLTAFFMIKTQHLTKKDKTFHLLWQAPLFGGFLCAICWLIMAQNSPHSLEFALIRVKMHKLGYEFTPGPMYVWALVTWIGMTVIGILFHLYVTPKFAAKLPTGALS